MTPLLRHSAVYVADTAHGRARPPRRFQKFTAPQLPDWLRPVVTVVGIVLAGGLLYISGVLDPLLRFVHWLVLGP